MGYTIYFYFYKKRGDQIDESFLRENIEKFQRKYVVLPGSESLSITYRDSANEQLLVPQVPQFIPIAASRSKIVSSLNPHLSQVLNFEFARQFSIKLGENYKIIVSDDTSGIETDAGEINSLYSLAEIIFALLTTPFWVLLRFVIFPVMNIF
jgi:hypothetical protein